MNEPHKHAELIKAWADGHDIQTRWRSTKTGEWTEWRDEEWNDVEFFYDHEYRIKPEPKPEPVKTTMYLYVTGTTQKQLWLDKDPPETFLYRTISDYIGSIEVLK